MSPLVLDAGGLVPAVELADVRADEVVQGLEVGRQGGREGVERDVLAAVGPDQVARDLQQHLAREHELDEGAGLDALPRAVIAGAAVLIAAEHAAGDLAVDAPDHVVVPVGRLQEVRVARLLVKDGRGAEALGDVDVVPTGDGLGPVRHALRGSAGRVAAGTPGRCGCRASRRSPGCRRDPGRLARGHALEEAHRQAARGLARELGGAEDRGLVRRVGVLAGAEIGGGGSGSCRCGASRTAGRCVKWPPVIAGASGRFSTSAPSMKNGRFSWKKVSKA